MFAAKAQPPQAQRAGPTEQPRGPAQGPQQAPFNPVWAGLALSIQPKLAISAPDDPYEQEADRVAERVMRMPVSAPADVGGHPNEAGAPSDTGALFIHRMPAASAGVQRLCNECAGQLPEDEVGGQAMAQRQPAPQSDPLTEDEPPLQRQATDPSALPAGPDVAAKVAAMSRGGSPLPAGTRAFFEPRFGADFSQVRVHTGGQATDTAKLIQAKAFTVGHHIAFADGHYAPDSQEGRKLLAHELTHTVQQGGSALKPKVPDGPNASYLQTGSAARVQRAWYNVDIPFTDYQFDPSISGIKNAAGIAKDTVVEGAAWVKDKAVSAVEWIYDKIKGLVESGLDWLKAQWAAIKAFASSAFDAVKNAFSNILGFVKAPLAFLANAILNFDPDSLNQAWSRFLKIAHTLKNGFKTLADTLLNQIGGLWNRISGFATSLIERVDGLTNNFVFNRLPGFMQDAAHAVIKGLKSFWNTIDAGWQGIFNKVKSWIDDAIDTIFKFVERIAAFGVQVIVKGIVEFGKLVLFLKDLFNNPSKYLNILAEKGVSALSATEGYFSSLVSSYFGHTKPAVATAGMAGTIQRTPEKGAEKEATSSASWSDIGNGVWGIMVKKWNDFKSNPLGIVKGLLMDMFLPMVGNVKDIIQLFKDIWKVVTGPLSAGSLEELWTSFLKLLDIPIMIYHTVVSILMRTLMVPLIVASFVRHPLVTAIASAVGEALLAAFVESELLNIGHKLLLLKTGSTNKEEKTEAYNRVADSVIAFAMAAAVAIIMFILHFIANVIKGVFNFIKGKVFPPKAAPVEAKPSTPVEAKPGAPEEAKSGAPEKGKSAADDKPAELRDAKEGLPSEDGSRKVKMNEEGKCEVCASPCDDIRNKYKKVITPEDEVKIKAIEDDPALTNLQKEEKLKPIEQKLADSLDAELASNPKFPDNEFPSHDMHWQQWPPAEPSSAKPKWNEPGGARWRYDRYRYEKWLESGKSATPPEDLLSPKDYFDRYVSPKARGQSPGELGSPEHKAAVEKVRKDNRITTETMGERRPDAVGKIDQPLKVGDQTITPKKGGRVLYEADNFFKDGSQIESEGRGQVRQFRKDNPDATIVVQDADNPGRIVVYEPGTQPPPPGRLPPGTPNIVNVE